MGLWLVWVTAIYNISATCSVKRSFYDIRKSVILVLYTGRQYENNQHHAGSQVNLYLQIGNGT